MSYNPKIYPQSIKGTIRRLKWIITFILLGIYYFTPFIRWYRGENIPNQAVLIDLPNRKAYFFFIEIWPQEVYYITAILIFAAIALFFVTAIFGRIWCGYACPQTIWTDLFIWVEKLVQGDRNQRIKLDKKKWSFERIWKKLFTHIIWLIIGLLTGGAWVLYFNDAPGLIRDIFQLDLSFNVAAWMFGLTLSTYIMAGFAREKVCTHMCPYSRFQSAMFDSSTFIITYDELRGEPRGAIKKGKLQQENLGDCIDCNKCVVVCPAGIDIREGLQMECISCGLCIDACNSVMEKLGRERNLIRYDTLLNLENQVKGITSKSKIIRPRIVFYGIILLIIGTIMLYHIFTRPEFMVTVTHNSNPLFVKLSNNMIRNSYNLKVINRTYEIKDFRLEIEGIENIDIRLGGARYSNVSTDKLVVKPDSIEQYRLFVTASRRDIANTVKKDENRNISEITINVIDNQTDNKISYETIFIGSKKKFRINENYRAK